MQCFLTTSVVAPEPQKQAFVELKKALASDAPIADPVAKLTKIEPESENVHQIGNNATASEPGLIHTNFQLNFLFHFRRILN